MPDGSRFIDTLPRTGPGKDKWEGSDLIIRKLMTENELNIGNFLEYTFTKSGDKLAFTIDALEQIGNGIQILDMKSGNIITPDSGRAFYKYPAWTEKEDALAVLKGTEDDDYEDNLYQVIGFRNFSAPEISKTIFDPANEKSFPEGLTVSDKRKPEWTEDLSGILFGIFEVKKKEKQGHAKQAGGKEEPKKENIPPPQKKNEIDKEDIPGLIIWHWKDKRLQSMQQVQQGRDKNFSYLCIYRPTENRFIRLADENLHDVQPAPKHYFALGYDDRPYELSGNLDGRRYRDIYVLDMKTGARRLAVEKCRWFFQPSPEEKGIDLTQPLYLNAYEEWTKKSGIAPDIVYTINDPGMSSVWCVIPAVEAAAATGVVDKSRVAIHGHSWGGYQTAFLITQTGLFKAAVAGAPLTNMISMYSSIYWNSGSANQPIFESSQGRFIGGYWENLEAYARNSPVYHAKNVTTPVIILHNDKDGAVDWNQGIEYYNTLRRLGKDVIMLQYKGENHGLRKPANQKDYTVRMREFFDFHLMGKPAPEWMKKGVPHLDHEEHIKTRTKQIIK